MSESDFTPLKSSRKPHFDPTINLGHVLTIATMFLAGLGMWSVLDKRVVVLEESRRAQEMTDRYQDQTVYNNMQQIRESLNDIKRNVEKVSERMEKKQ